jgi:GABA permease
MRNPVRSETDAFYVAWGSAFVIGVSVALGALVDPLVGIALFVGAVAGVLAWELATKDPDRRRPLREAASQGRRGAEEKRPCVLVIANRTLDSDELRGELRARIANGSDLHVVAPIVTSRVHYIASDVDGELEDARRRLAEAIAWCEGQGIEVSGKVGDPMSAFAAIEDELRAFAADEVLISTYPRGRSNWLETGIVERLRDELEIPVTHIVAEGARADAGAAR